MFFLEESHYYNMKWIESNLMTSPVSSSEYCLFWVHQNKDIMMLMELFYETITHTWNILKLWGNTFIVHIKTKKDRDDWWQLAFIGFVSLKY